MKLDLDQIEQQAIRSLAEGTEHPMRPIPWATEPAVVLEMARRIRELERELEIWKYKARTKS